MVFGNLEYVLKIINSKIFFNLLKPSKESKSLIDYVISNQSFYKQINILNFYLCGNSQKINMGEWDSFFKIVKNLEEKRNIFTHNMYGVNDDKLLKFKIDKNGKTEELLFSKNDLNKINSELQERYRQVFDSFLTSHEHYIIKYKKLILPITLR